ncbi:MAG TPA: hypothetical protein VFN30_06700 [Chitinophagaceae bacterium]|nr:hypothetical protein [Chitinophagaceae bacterium]
MNNAYAGGFGIPSVYLQGGTKPGTRYKDNFLWDFQFEQSVAIRVRVWGVSPSANKPADDLLFEWFIVFKLFY